MKLPRILLATGDRALIDEGADAIDFRANADFFATFGAGTASGSSPPPVRACAAIITACCCAFEILIFMPLSDEISRESTVDSSRISMSFFT